MYCPLCKSEYREGITSCKDCNTPLLATREEAQRIPTSIFWKGSSQQQFDEITAALEDAGIPFATQTEGEPSQVAKEALMGLLKVMFWKFNAFGNRKSKLMDWQIRVLQSDYQRAKEVVHPPVHKE